MIPFGVKWDRYIGGYLIWDDELTNNKEISWLITCLWMLRSIHVEHNMMFSTMWSGTLCWGSMIVTECDAFLSLNHYLVEHWSRPSMSVLWYHLTSPGLNTLRPRQNCRHFADDTFKRIFLNEIVRISIKISLKFVPKGPINNIPTLVQIMAWRRSGDKPLSEPMMVSLLTQVCVTRPQWVNEWTHSSGGKMTTILQATFPNAFARIKILILIKFHWTLFLRFRLTICHIGSDNGLATKHYEPMMVRLSTHVCITQPQWFKPGL